MMLMVTACITVARIGILESCPLIVTRRMKTNLKIVKLLSPYGSMEHGVLENIITRIFYLMVLHQMELFLLQKIHTRRMQFRP